MRAWLIGLAVLLSACSNQSMFDKLATPEEQAFSTQMVRAVRADDLATLKAAAAPELRPQLTPASMAQMRAPVPNGEPSLQNVNVQWMNGVTAKALDYEIGANGRWAMVRVVLSTGAGKPQLIGLHTAPATSQPSQFNAFTLKDKGAIHFAWLAAMVACVATSLTAFVLILRTRGLRRKWLWAPASLISFVTFSLNWTTGAFGVMPISLLLFGAAALQRPLEPWIFSFAVPVVAIVFLIRRAMGVYAVPPAAAEPDTAGAT